MPVTSFANFTPVICDTVFVASDATVIGNVKIADYSSIFFAAVLRGDINAIEVGSETNIQEHCLLHTSHGLGPCIVGDQVTVGHRVILHGCHVKGRSIIGMGSTVLDQAVIGEFCIVGANSLITKGTQVPDGSLVLGSPAKVIRQLTVSERQDILDSARSYRDLAKKYLG